MDSPRKTGRDNLGKKMTNVFFYLNNFFVDKYLINRLSNKKLAY